MFKPTKTLNKEKQSDAGTTMVSTKDCLTMRVSSEHILVKSYPKQEIILDQQTMYKSKPQIKLIGFSD